MRIDLTQCPQCGRFMDEYQCPYCYTSTEQKSLESILSYITETLRYLSENKEDKKIDQG